ncbi:hypothetical protein BST61_g1125 [Cercospora zeina]
MPREIRKSKPVTFAEQQSPKRKKHVGKEDHNTNDENAAQEDVFIRNIHARPINGRYLLGHKLGEGGFGMVFLGRDIIDGREVALKLEHRSVVPSILEHEAERCRQFQDLAGFPQMFWYGWHDHYKVMAFELLGPSLEDLFAFCGHRFSLKTTFMLIDHLLQRLESLHSRNIVHRDINPQNCLMGTGGNGNVVYITDFGLAEDANSEDDPPGTRSIRPWLIGTARYASIRGHEGRTQSFRDDLESLGYTMIYLARGHLPWQGLKGRRRQKEELVLERKRSITVEDLCASLPEEFVTYMEMPSFHRASKSHPMQ